MAWYGEPKRHSAAAIKGLKTKGLKRRRYKRTARGLNQDRGKKAKNIRHPWQPSWRGDIRGRRV